MTGIELIIFFVISVLAVSAVMVSLALSVPGWVIISVSAVLIIIALIICSAFVPETERIDTIKKPPLDTKERQALLSMIAARTKAEREAREKSDILHIIN
jgi:hypothetical protein